MDRLKDGGRHLLAFLKWMAIAIVVGGVMGAVGTGFHIALEWAAETRGHFPWLLWLLPAGGLLIVFLYRSCGVSNPKGTNLLLETIREKDKLPRSMAPLISVATVITHLFGGSAGREGAVLQLGGGIAYEIGRVLRLDEKDLHIITINRQFLVMFNIINHQRNQFLRERIWSISIVKSFYKMICSSLIAGIRTVWIQWRCFYKIPLRF